MSEYSEIHLPLSNVSIMFLLLDFSAKVYLQRLARYSLQYAIPPVTSSERVSSMLD